MDFMLYLPMNLLLVSSIILPASFGWHVMIPESENNFTEVMKCLSKLLDTIPTASFVTGIIVNPKDVRADMDIAEAYKILHMQPICTMVLDCSYSRSVPIFSRRNYIFVILTQTMDQLMNTATLYHCSYWDPGVTFIVLFMGYADDVQIMLFFQRLRELEVHKVLLISIGQVQSEIYIWSWLPYKYKNCQNRSKISELNLVATFKENVFKKEGRSIWFPVPAHLDGCPIRVGINLMFPFATSIQSNLGEWSKFPYLGTDVGLLTVFAGQTNGTLQYDGNTHINGTHISYDRLISKLGEGQFDILIGGLMPITKHYSFVAYTKPREFNRLLIILKNFPDRKDFLFTIIDNSVWLFLALLFCIIFVLNYSITRKYKLHNTTSLARTFINYWSAMLGNPINLTYHEMKINALLWILLTFFVRSGFNAYILPFLIQINSKSPVNNLQDLCRNNYKVLTLKSVDILLFQDLKDCSNDSLLQINTVEDPMSVLFNSEYNERVAAFVPELHYRFRLFEFQDLNDNKSPFTVLKDNLMTIPLVYFVQRGGVLRDILNEYTAYQQQDGVLSQLISSSIYLNTMYGFYSRKGNSTQVIQKKLSFDELNCVFYMFIAGISISLFVFIVEIISYFRHFF